MSHILKIRKFDLIAGTLYFFFTLIITYPLIFQMNGLTTGLGDELLIAWIHSWVIHAIDTNILLLFQGNIFYPFHNSLAFSDVFFTTSILSYIPVKLMKEPIVANNFIILFSLTLNSLAVYFLTYYLTKGWTASFIAGLIVLSSPVVLEKVVHIQMLFLFLIPLSVITFLQFLEKQKYYYLISSCILLLIQVYTSFLPAYFIVFSWLILIITYRNVQRFRIVFHLKTVLIFLLTVFCMIPVILPYYQVSSEFDYVRDIRESVHYSLHPLDFLYPNNLTHIDAQLMSFQQIFGQVAHYYYKPGYPGIGFLFLFISSTYFLIKKNVSLLPQEKSMLFISSYGLIMSLGPFLHIFRETVTKPFLIPLPYLFMYYLVPGMKGLRNTARWEVLFVLFAAVFIGIMVHTFLKKKARVIRLLILCVVTGLLIGELRIPIQFQNIPSLADAPTVYHWVTTLPEDAVIIEMPIYNWNMFPYGERELLRNYYSTIHFRRTVNGASGFSPPPWQRMVENLMADFPNKDAIDQLYRIGVQYIIIHTDEYDELNKNAFAVENKQLPNSRDVIKQLNQSSQVFRVKSFDNSVVYKIK